MLTTIIPNHWFCTYAVYSWQNKEEQERRLEAVERRWGQKQVSKWAKTVIFPEQLLLWSLRWSLWLRFHKLSFFSKTGVSLWLGNCSSWIISTHSCACCVYLPELKSAEVTWFEHLCKQHITFFISFKTNWFHELIPHWAQHKSDSLFQKRPVLQSKHSWLI